MTTVKLNGRRIAATLAAVTLWAFAAACSAQVQLSVEAISGEPFGVGRVSIDMADEALPEALGADGLGLREKDGRVLYPVVDAPMLRPLLKEVFSATPLLTGGPVRQELRGVFQELLDRPPRKTIYFLFTGAGPLELTLLARAPTSFRAAVAANPAAHRQLLQTWWERYTAPPRLLESKPDYPPLVENYLKASLARRLNLKLPRAEQTESPREILRREVALLFGSESVRLAMQQDRMLGLHHLAMPADQPLPEPIDSPPLESPPAPANVAIEPLAMRVPEECFYVRFGRFSNFLWTQDMLARWGGDLQNLIATRGLDQDLTRRIERQLVVQQTAIGKLVANAVIDDVAIFGSDLFFREGAAYGLILEAKNNLPLTADLTRQRLERIAAGAKEEKLKIGKHEVSYLSSADGEVRSYYAAHGVYHCLTTSRQLIERFLAAADGERPLGAAADFRHARTVMPLARDDTVFIYLSDAFFRRLTSPHYRIEMTRRLQAETDIEAVQLAALAAATEGKPGGTVERLVAGALLPPDFGPRPDGSQTVLDKGEVFDRLRGRRGRFVPVPDVPLTHATQAEVTDYRKFAEFYRENWGRMDPMMVALKRQALSGGREQVTIDLQLNPFARQHFDFISQWFGAADNRRMATVPGDIAAVDVIFRNQRIFAGIRDVALPIELASSRTLQFGRLRDVIVGYIGTTGEVGLLSFLEPPPLPLRDLRGTAFGPLGMVRQRAGEFTVFSLQPEVLAQVMPQLRFDDAPQPAQLRLEVGDVTRAKVIPFLNNLGYTRTLDTSLGNLRLLYALEQQLHVPARECHAAAEFLLAAKLVCPLGGKYVFHEGPKEVGRWTTTALEGVGRRAALGVQAPPGYEAPPLSWFRDLLLRAAMTESALTAHAEVTMQLPARAQK